MDKGTTYNGFIVKKSTEMKELKCRLVELVHKNTNAEVIHIANDDPENVFCFLSKLFPKHLTASPIF